MRPTAARTGDFDCDFNALVGGEVIYAAGRDPRRSPSRGGKGVHVAAGQYVVLVSHLNNTSASPVTASTTVEGRVGTAADVTTPIDMFFAGKLNFVIPAGADTVPIAAQCGVNSSMHIFATIPLMHSLGVTQTFLYSYDTTGFHTIADSQFDPHHLAYTSLPADLLVPPAEGGTI
jgi:hypothetical protein